MTLSEAETKTELRYNVCDDATVKEKCDMQYRTERYSLITVSDSVLF